MSDLVGQQLGNYQLVSLLGKGGFASAYRGKNIHLGKQVAIKVLNTLVTEEEIKKLKDEGYNLANLEHQNIVQVFDFDVKDDIPFLVMEYIPNGNLAEYRSRGIPLPWVTIVSYIKQVAAALQYAHDHMKLIHRDVKPANMLLRKNNDVVLSDFGIALIIESAHNQALQRATGTVSYMAPEQLQGNPCFASDQYALAIVAYEWSSGNLPFHGSAPEVMSQHLFTIPPSLKEKVPQGVEAVLLRALAKDSKQRFTHVQDFADALEIAYYEDRRTAQISVPHNLGQATSNHSQIPLISTENVISVSELTLPQKPRASSKVLISQYSGVMRRYYNLLNEYERGKNDFQNRYESEIATNEATSQAARAQATAVVEEVRRIVNSTQHTLTSSRWQKMTDGINSTPFIIPAGVDNTAQLITYRLKAIEASNAVSSYVEEKSPLQKLQELVSNHLSNKWMYLIVLAVIAGIILLNIIFGLTMLVISLLVLVTPILSGIVLQLIYNKKAEAQLKNTYATLIEASSTVEATFTQQNNFIQNMYIRRRAENTTQHQRVMQNLDLALQMKLAELRSIVSTSEQDAKLLVADWNDPRWQQWTPFEVTVPVTRLGVWKVQERQEFPLIPALVACPSEENILFKAAGAAKNTALSAIQSLILRLLVMQPPGKVLFTFIDPVDLGQNVATFMQLTDDDEKLVNSKAWTEKQHIEKQLADLSEHMETIIQKYLRNQYNTIDDYNAIAGELAEPYRILVVIGFPNNFTEDAARRLISIAANGPRCGVSTLILMDTDQPQPHRFHVSELARFTNVIAWNGNGFIWEHEEIEGSKLLLDSPPPSGMFNYFLKYVGEKAKETHKVEVPFRRMVERIVPEYSWWADEHSTREEIRVPLGPAGATRYQYFRLGKGTAHHALVVGKTGAGKTNLLQALIIGLCLTYSANELELYLVDFKTVGFTPYANYKLPHARVVAIQSEREFGLSVLKGLFSELEERKRLFSRSSVQNIVQYRLVQPKARMPRILLLVDEFQEFFTHEDKIAKEAASLLDRLVRMGRAFGIHVMLCSQTLVGTHTLDRSTISQMDIRIAMQCEEADSRLILSEDNSEARLLSRPGEAIYNAENGAVAGNNRFQCAWLPDEELHVYLNAIQQLAQRYQYVPPKTQNIFDGSKNADINENHVFEHVLQAPTWPTTKLPVKYG